MANLAGQLGDHDSSVRPLAFLRQCANLSSLMAITSSAKKAIRVAARKRVFNLRRQKTMREAIKEVTKVEIKVGEPNKIIIVIQNKIYNITFLTNAMRLINIKLLESDKKYSKVLDLSDIPPSHPVFDNYLRGALMDISYN